MTRSLPITPAGWLGILAIALMWGGSFPAIAIALGDMPVSTLVAFRVGGAALLLWPWILLRGLALPRGWRIWAALALAGFVANVLPFQLIAWGETHIDSGLAAILNASTALFGVLTAALFFRDERLTLRKLAGVGLGLAGVTVIMGLDSLRHLDLASLAQLAVLAASLCYALGAIWGRVALGGLAPEVATAGMLGASTVMMVPLVLVLDGVPDVAAWSWQGVAAAGYLALFSSAVAYIIYYRLLPRIGAANVQLCTLLAPAFAVGLGAVLLGESLPASAYLGFAILVAGLVVLGGWLGGAFRWLRYRARLARVRFQFAMGRLFH